MMRSLAKLLICQCFICYLAIGKNVRLLVMFVALENLISALVFIIIPILHYSNDMLGFWTFMGMMYAFVGWFLSFIHFSRILDDARDWSDLEWMFYDESD